MNLLSLITASILSSVSGVVLGVGMIDTMCTRRRGYKRAKPLAAMFGGVFGCILGLTWASNGYEPLLLS